jgi:hypothetical protein
MAATEQTERLNDLASDLDALRAELRRRVRTNGELNASARDLMGDVGRTAADVALAVAELGRNGVLSPRLQQLGDAGFDLSQVGGELAGVLDQFDPTSGGSQGRRRVSVDDRFKSFEAFLLVQSGVPRTRAADAVKALRTFAKARQFRGDYSGAFGLAPRVLAMRQQIQTGATISIGTAIRMVMALKKISLLGIVIEVDGQLGGRFGVVGAVSQHMAAASANLDQSLLVDAGA